MRPLTIFFILLLFGSSVYSQAALPKVISAVEPKGYPMTAMALGALGKVEILVVIDAAGKVISAEAISGHPLLRQGSREAAVKWEFEQVPEKMGNRSIVLTFEYNPQGRKTIEQSEKLLDVSREVTFPAPYWMKWDAFWLVPKLLLLPREKGKIKPAYCELHKELMEVEILPIHYGLSACSGNCEEYAEAKNELFPNVNDSYDGGCQVGETEKAEVHYCKTCRAKEEEWIKQRSN